MTAERDRVQQSLADAQDAAAASQKAAEAVRVALQARLHDSEARASNLADSMQQRQQELVTAQSELEEVWVSAACICD